MTAADHPFDAYPPDTVHSPRSCRRCGRIPEVHPAPPAPGHAERDPDVEAAVIAQALHGTALDAAPLWSFAGVRAHPWPVRTTGRSLRRESLEELADLLNYLVWEVAYELQPRALAGDSVAAARIPSRLGAIRHAVKAWHILHLP